MNDDLKGLLEEYCSSLKGIRHLHNEAKKKNRKHDASLISSMESDLEWTIEYMATGFMPAYSEGHYKKVVPVDPQKIFLWANKSPEAIDYEKQKKNRELIDDLLKPLTDREAEAVLLVKAYGVSEGKAAWMMGISKDTVSCYVDRAINKIFRIRPSRLT